MANIYRIKTSRARRMRNDPEYAQPTATQSTPAPADKGDETAALSAKPRTVKPLQRSYRIKEILAYKIAPDAEKLTHIHEFFMSQCDAQPEAQLAWGRKLFEFDYRDEAMHAVARAASNAPAHASAPRDLILDATLLLQERGFSVVARSVMDAALKHYPEHVPFLFLQARDYMRGSNHEQACVLLEQAHKIMPNDEQIVSALGQTYMELKRIDDTLRLLTPAAKRFASNKTIAYNLAHAHKKQQRYKDAISLLKPFSDNAQHAQDANLHSLLGVCYTRSLQRLPFDEMKGRIPKTLRDTLDAQLFYLQGFTAKAVGVLEPHMQENAWEKPDMVSLYLACVSFNHPIYKQLRANLSRKKFTALETKRDAWFKHPSRPKAVFTGFYAGDHLWETGAIPINGDSRRGTSMRAPIGYKKI